MIYYLRKISVFTIDLKIFSILLKYTLEDILNGIIGIYIHRKSQD